MTELWDSLWLLILLLGASGAGLLVRPLLSERHRSRETVELIQLVVTMLVTFAALVLGLLTTSVKASFDTIGNDVRGFATDIIQLDQLLTEYGSAADPVRQQLRVYTAAAIASTWSSEPAPPGNYYPRRPARTSSDAMLESSALGVMLTQIELRIRELPPTDAVHQRLISDALDQYSRLIQRRWTLIEQAHNSISMPFYLVLTFWLAIVFASFGLSTPRNALAGITILMGALSIASATFVILELDSPFEGLMTVNSQPMRDALAHLSR
ncbi:MAG TPA: hypothetical protein VLI93_08125 [Acetobacteraceae bacterium]|nr:hypothetical protein [Acetobacteraceae bacterium]